MSLHKGSEKQDSRNIRELKLVAFINVSLHVHDFWRLKIIQSHKCIERESSGRR